MAKARRLAPTLWSLVLTLAVLGGALGPGYVLSYDMVWVPDLSLTPDVWGVGTALPRAVPSDAVVAVLDNVIPAAVLQKLMLVGSLVAAGTGAAALVADRSVPARLVAVTIAIANPFVVERMVLGHWPLLVGYAALPWLIVTLRDPAGEDRLPPSVPALLLVGSLSASAGLATTVAALALGIRRGRPRRTLILLGWLVAANAPWIVAGLVRSSSATSDATGAELFATADEGMLLGPLAALSLGGVWNAEVVPTSRTGWAGVLLTVLLVVAIVVAILRLVRGRAQVAALGGLIACWMVGYGLAVVSWASPASLGWLAAQVPGGGLIRDGSRLLGLAVPLIVVLVAVAVDSLLERLPDRASRVLVGGVLVVVPLTLMPDALLGAGGRLTAVTYPASYDAARAAVAQAPGGAAISLPFVSYRAPLWNDGGRRVLDPLGRYLDRSVVVNDELVVSGTRIAGEDPRAQQALAALGAVSAEERAARLRAIGVSVVVVERIEGYPVPAIAGSPTLEGELTVVELGPADTSPVSRAHSAFMGVAWLAWIAVPIGVPIGAAGAVGWSRRRTKR